LRRATAEFKATIETNVPNAWDNTDTVINNVEATIDCLLRREIDAIMAKELNDKAKQSLFGSNSSSVIVKPVSNKRSEFYQAAANNSKEQD
jgi:hypothetical protein